MKEIREELRSALAAATGNDPIDWLEKRIKAGKRRGNSEVAESLRRFLEETKSKRPRKRRAGSKK